MKTNNSKPFDADETEVKNGHVNDVNNKAQAAKSPATKKSAKPWQNVLVGGVPGIILGAGAVVAAQGFTFHAPDPDPVPEPTPDPAELEIKVADSVNDDMSFREAFNAARDEVGPGGAFCWHGNVYSTYSTEDPEWANMTQEQRVDHCRGIISNVHPQPYTPTSTEPSITPVGNAAQNGADDQNGSAGQGDGNDQGGSAAQNGADDQNGSAGQEEVDVHIVGVERTVDEDGSVHYAGYGEVDGHASVFVDEDGDGVVDTVLIDTNDDNQIEVNEVFDASEAGITVDELVAAAEENQGDVVDDNFYEDTPDYTNDADVSDLI